MKSIIKNIFLILIFTSTAAFSQIANPPFLNDPLEDEIFEFDWDDSFAPMIELNYGLVNFKQKNFAGNFSDVGIAEVKLGYNSTDEFYKRPILEFHDKFLLVSYISDEFSSNSTTGEIPLEAWRFGFANRNGYGYQAGPISILPYDQNGLVWTQIKSKRPTGLIENDNLILDRYENSFRFGSQAEGGIRIDYNEFVSLNVGYESSVIFPRHLFWKWLGSESIKYIGLAGLSLFTDEIIESTPEAGPILNFILQNAFAYGFYSLQRNSMNWPFSSETPLTFETFKVGLSFTF